MPLRLNLLADEAVRRDLIEFVRGLLREHVTTVARELLVPPAAEFPDQGFLGQCVARALKVLDLRAMVAVRIRDELDRRAFSSAGVAAGHPHPLKDVVEDVVRRSGRLEDFRTEARQIAEDKSREMVMDAEARSKKMHGDAVVAVQKILVDLAARIREMPEERVRAIVADELRRALGAPAPLATRDREVLVGFIDSVRCDADADELRAVLALVRGKVAGQ